MNNVFAQIEWSLLTPETTIIAGIVLLLLMDLIFPSSLSRKWFGFIGLASVLGALVFVVGQLPLKSAEILFGTYRLDPMSLVFKLLFLTSTALILLVAMDRKKADRTDRYIAEEYILMLSALLGAMFLASSVDVITLFIGLELLSISSYILVGMRKHERLATEAAWKYVIYGGVSSAFFLYGYSFLYGISGTTNLFTLGQSLSEVVQSTQSDLFIIVGLCLMLVGFAFKISLAPFHMWAPDVYQGASSPVASFLAVVSKAAGILFLIRFLLIGMYPLLRSEVWGENVMWALAILAAVSMIVGNTVALRQQNVKRILAYSGIAQAGYLFIIFPSLQSNLIFVSVVFYLVVYMFMTIGAFAVVHVVSKETGNDELTSFDGLVRRSPGLGIAMTLFLLSLAGIPLTAGFIGKVNLSLNTFASSHMWLLISTLLVTTVISYYYYFRIVQRMFVENATSDQKIPISIFPALTILVVVLGTIGLGIVPDILLSKLEAVKWGYGLIPLEGIQQLKN
ncbi:NADH-quinone oxidoreductase subunit N [Thermoactinomyces sp. DSM 45891]|uniref:NADH-quinone oxidoreductase subunit N n=1 Tax=Thermoactinomyces sp. DSM 45891 TaxID=1761907 RepID=UPI0009156D0F|nr:NADH-quinone oxidoreductase subunit N [Thermoactinomyces sp. DSM 45891]SFX23905.1 NADH-quinone oxidoreductase subunit N [Thermoactinomyces sp. DSM 45891]